MHQISFGNVLKEARLARGLDLAVVSRELRIRQDILVAIENSDFARMPSRGYARNMIIAYARLVGLNPQDISRMYLDQEYAHQVEKAHRSVGNTIQMHNEPYQHSGSTQRGTTGRFNQVDRSSRNFRSSYNSDQTRATRRTAQSNAYDGSSNGFGRRMYSQNADEPPYAPRNNAPVAHRARRSAMTDGRYTNLYSAPKNIPNPNRNRNIIIGVVVAAVLVIVLIVALFLTHRSEPQTNIPVTGVDVTAQPILKKHKNNLLLKQLLQNLLYAMKLLKDLSRILKCMLMMKCKNLLRLMVLHNNLTLRRELSDLFPLKRVGLPFILTMKQ